MYKKMNFKHSQFIKASDLSREIINKTLLNLTQNCN